MKFSILPVLAIASSTAHAATLATFNFDNSTLANSTPTSGYTVTDLSFPTTGTALENMNTVTVTNSVAFAGNGTNNNKLQFSTSGQFQSTPALGVTAGQYLTFTITATTGTLDLTALNLDHSRTSSAPRQLAVYGATAANPTFSLLQTYSNGNSTTPLALDTLDLTNKSISFAGITSATFRLVMFEHNTNKGVGQFDNIVLSGTVIPEPSTALLSALGILALLRRRR